MAEELLISLMGDKGGVGKSTIALLLAEWMVSKGRAVRLIDADPNQTVQICIDKGVCVATERKPGKFSYSSCA
jgi:CO dehydrogenase nickel-insertion accessory protein CooC1